MRSVSFSPSRSSWRRSAPGPPTSSSGGRRASTPRRTRRSGRSSPPSSRRPASRSSSSSIRRTELPDKIVAALEAGQPPDFAFGMLLTDYIAAVGLRGSARRPLRRGRPLRGPVRSGRARLRSRCSTRRPGRGPLRAADGPRDQPRPRLEEPAGAGGLHPRRHPEGVGGVLVLLVRPGAAGRAPGHWAATTSGASGCRCRSTPATPTNQF